MNSSQTIAKISAALVKSQAEMTNAKKGATNPFFNKKYADLNSIREAALPVLNAHGITVIQPTTIIDGVDYVETILLHESGEYISSLTKVVVGKANDAQSHGSGLSYARRYALQSIVCLGAEDDDANAAVQQPKAKDHEMLQRDINATTGKIEKCQSRGELDKLWKGLSPELRAVEQIIAGFKLKSLQYAKP
jgi:hypothetical protein